MSITLRQIKYFVATAELGQISQAAVQLNISQSAVTSAIKELEDIVGAQMFKRSPHGMELTDVGRGFLNRAYSILSAVDEALQIPSLQSTVSGTLTVAATYTVIGYFLPFHLQRLGQLYPSLKIKLHELHREAIEEGLISNRYDMSVLLTSNVMNPELELETFFSSERRLWVSSQHPFLKKQPVTMKDISLESYIMLTVDEAVYTSLKYWNETPYQPNITLRTSSVEAVRSMVANGSGVAILSDMVYRPWSLEGKRIETITLTDKIPPMSVGLASKKGVEYSPAMMVFREYFRRLYMEPQLGHFSHKNNAY
jgi:DNA-binding transcriptional LysR family regulator